jgi:hypothetical protein
MNMLSKLKKKSAATDPVAADTAAHALLGDLQPLIGLANPIRTYAVDHRRILDALGKARFALRYQKDASPPEMRLAIQREMVIALGDAEAVASFDKENGAALKAEIEAREQFLREKDLLPARIAALENLVQESAKKMMDNLPIVEIEEEAQKLFTPYAEQLLATAKAYAQARSLAKSAAHVIKKAVTLHQYDVAGNYRVLAEPDLMSKIAQADILPNTMAGVDWEILRDVNYQANAYDDAALAEVGDQLRAIGLTGDGLTVYRNKGEGDPRSFYAPEPAGPARPPEAHPYGAAARVVINVA